MKKTQLLLLISIILVTLSCVREDGKIPNIAFKTNTGYKVGDFGIDPGTKYVVGIKAEESENGDKLKHFKITRAVNDSAMVTYFEKDLTGDEKTSFTYDLNSTSLTISGIRVTLVFSVVSDDDISNSVSATYTVK